MKESLSRTMSSQLAVLLRDRILAGTYAPGTTLVQDSIAAEFGVSKIPVREALLQLRGEGLIDIFSHRGFQVRPLSASEFEEVFRLRLKIEPQAVAEGSRKASEEDRKAASQAYATLNRAMAEEDLGASGNLNRAFHLALIVPRVQPVAAEVLGRLLTLSQRYVQVHLSSKVRNKKALRQHSDLMETWSTGKYKQVAELTQEHIEGTRDDLAKVFANTR